MTTNIDLKMDMNRALEQKASRSFTKIIIFTILVLLILATGAAWYFGANGKDVISPFLTITSPTNKAAGDTVKANNDSHIDNSKKLEIKDNHGKMDIKF